MIEDLPSLEDSLKCESKAPCELEAQWSQSHGTSCQLLFCDQHKDASANAVDFYAFLKLMDPGASMTCLKCGAEAEPSDVKYRRL